MQRANEETVADMFQMAWGIDGVASENHAINANAAYGGVAGSDTASVKRLEYGTCVS
jgi:hypothetical protein